MLRRLLTPLRDPQSWVDVAWGIVSFVTAIIAFVVTVTWWAVAARRADLLVLGALAAAQRRRHDTLAELIGLGDARSTEIWLNLGIGVVALLPLPLVVRAFTLLHAGLADAMLSGRGPPARRGGRLRDLAVAG